MRRSFGSHAGIAAGLSAVLSAFVALTWLPGVSPPGGTGWPVVVLLSACAVFGTGVLSMAGTRGNPRPLWSAFRGLPARVHVVLGVLFAAGVVMIVASAVGGEGAYQPLDAAGGRYFVLDLSVSPHARTEVSRSLYETVVEDQQRLMLALSGLICVWATCLVLVGDRLRREDPASGNQRNLVPGGGPTGRR